MMQNSKTDNYHQLIHGLKAKAVEEVEQTEAKSKAKAKKKKKS